MINIPVRIVVGILAAVAGYVLLNKKKKIFVSYYHDADKIKQCDVFVVLIGKKAHKREWIGWEIAKAKEYGKKIVAIKEERSHASPEELLSAGAEWVYGFEEKRIREAIEG